MTIEQEVLDYVKRHIRIMHNEDDELIKVEIQAAIEYIYKQLLLANGYPSSTNNLTEKQKLATAHLVAQWRSNPDGMVAISDKYRVVNKRLIRNILGDELNYMPTDITKIVKVTVK